MRRLQRWADGVLFEPLLEPTAIAIGATHGGYFVASLAALVCMAAVPVDEQWPCAPGDATSSPVKRISSELWGTSSNRACECV